VARREDEGAVRGARRAAQPTVLLVEEHVASERLPCLDREAPDVLLFQRSNDERVIPCAPTGAGQECCAGHRVAHSARAPRWVAESSERAARAKRCRPAEIRTRGHEIDLVLPLIAGVSHVAGAGPVLALTPTRF